MSKLDPGSGSRTRTWTESTRSTDVEAGSQVLLIKL